MYHLFLSSVRIFQVIFSVIVDLIERNINRRLFEIGFLYPRNVDRNGNPLGMFHKYIS